VPPRTRIISARNRAPVPENRLFAFSLIPITVLQKIDDLLLKERSLLRARAPLVLCASLVATMGANQRQNDPLHPYSRTKGAVFIAEQLYQN
jgi:hypothetical protein